MADRELIEALKSSIASIERSGEVERVGDSGASSRFDAKKAESPSIRPGQARARGEIDPSDSDSAFTRIARWISHADRSENQVRTRLAREGYEQSAIDDAVERARRCGFVDDARYASTLVRSRISQGKGMSGIERELSEQGIDAYSVEGWPYEFVDSDPSEEERAYAVLEAKPPRSKNIRESAYRKLVAKGYDSATASRAARRWAEKNDSRLR